MILPPPGRQNGVYFDLDAITMLTLVADVAELADALDSKSGIREDVWVRPPPSAPFQSSLTHRTSLSSSWVW